MLRQIVVLKPEVGSRHASPTSLHRLAYLQRYVKVWSGSGNLAASAWEKELIAWIEELGFGLFLLFTPRAYGGVI